MPCIRHAAAIGVEWWLVLLFGVPLVVLGFRFGVARLSFRFHRGGGLAGGPGSGSCGAKGGPNFLHISREILII